MNGQRVIGITFVAVLMLVAIVLLIQAGRFLLGEGSDTSLDLTEETAVVEENREITNFIEEGASAIFVNDGEITGTEDHNRIEIEITDSKRELRIISGYSQTVTTRESFDNNEAAYTAFMHALAFEGILASQEAAFPTVDGVCPSGQRFEFILDLDGTDNDSNLWASSCSTRHGNFDGDRRAIERLFENQIPEYRELTRGISL